MQKNFDDVSGDCNPSQPSDYDDHAWTIDDQIELGCGLQDSEEEEGSLPSGTMKWYGDLSDLNEEVD